MNNKQPILSICIPTYNRCEILDESLSILFSNPDFDSGLIEVIVSDNCSTDQTAEIIKKYPLAKYYKTEKNIVDANFTFVLEKATGLYIRLFNDTLRFNEGRLKKMLDIIERHKNEEKNLFFFQNMFLHKNCVKEVCNKNEFLKASSFYSGWIANFGCWKNDFEKITDKNRFIKTQFLQVDWLYKIVANQKKSLIYFDDFFEVATLQKKGGYNTFDTFANKYLGLIKKQKIPFLDYKIEKYRLLRYLILSTIVVLKIKNRYNFDTKNWMGILLKRYWYEPHLVIVAITLYIISPNKK